LNRFTDSRNSRCMIRSAAALIAVCLFVAGCRSTPEVKKAPAASTFKFEPTAGAAMIILYRNSAGFMGGGAMVNSTVTIDNKALGDLMQDRYAEIGVGAGEHMVNLQGVSGVSNVMVNLAPGEVKFIQVITYPSLMTSQTDKETGIQHLDNEGEPLQLGFKYSFGAATAPASADPKTTNL
jgi:hypothetical protein